MNTNEAIYKSACFVTLPPMRTVYNIAVGSSPEDRDIRVADLSG